MGKRLYQTIKDVYSCLLELLLPKPSYCNGCGRQLVQVTAYQLCSICETHIHFHGTTAVATGASVEIADTVMAAAPFPILVAVEYEGLAKELVYKLKYKDKRECAITMAAYMKTQIANMAEYDCIVPVPISAVKRKKRGYNHMELVACELHEITGIQVSCCLLRVKDTKPQVLFNEGERWYNVKGCFRCNERLDGQRVLLVDDLISTGATAFYCREQLLSAGARSVTPIAFARSIRF